MSKTKRNQAGLQKTSTLDVTEDKASYAERRPTRSYARSNHRVAKDGDAEVAKDGDTEVAKDGDTESLTSSNESSEDEDYEERATKQRIRHRSSSPQKSSTLPRKLHQVATRRSNLFLMVQKGEFHTVRSLLDKWHTSYDEEYEQIGLHLFNFILEAAGFPGDFVAFDDAEGKKPQEIIDEALGTLDLQGFGLNSKFPLKTNERGLTTFSERFRNFWILLVTTFEDDLLNRDVFKHVVTRVLPFTGHMIRNLRHAGTVAGFAFCEGVIDLLAADYEDRKRYNIQLNAEPLKLTSSSIRNTIKQKLSECEKRILSYEEYIADLYVSLSIRWRDRCPAIRKVTFEALFRSVKKCPELFLEDSKKCRFLGYALYDRDSSIRISASQFLAEIVEDDDMFGLLTQPTKSQPGVPGPSFLNGFLVRLIELPNDVEPQVCVAGMKILTKIAQKDYLSNEQVEQVIECLWECPSFFNIHHHSSTSAKSRHTADVYSELRTAIAQFINTTTFTSSVFRDWPKSQPGVRNENASNDSTAENQRDALDLRAILEFIVEFAEGYVILTDRLVSAFWNKTASLRCVGSLLDFLTVGDSNNQVMTPLDDRYRLPLITLIRSVYRHLDLSAHVDGSTGVTSEIATRWLNEATSTILNRMPSIIRVCKSDPAVMSVAASIIFLASLNAENIRSQIDIRQCLKVLSDAFLNCSFLSAFDYFGIAISNIEIIEEGSVRLTQEMVDRVMTEIRGTIKTIKARKKKKTSEDVTKQYTELGVSLRRLLSIIKSANYNILWDNWDMIDILSDICDSRLYDSEHINTFITLVSLQCLSLATFHLESDIQEFENETQLQEQENQIVVSTTINNKSTDNSMVSNKEIEEEEISKTKSGRKRIRSSTGEEDSLLGRSKKRRRQRVEPATRTTNGYLDNLCSLIEERLNRLTALRISLSMKCINFMRDDQSPYIQYMACTSLLDSMRLLNYAPLTAEPKRLWIDAQKEMAITHEELTSVTKYLKTCVGDLEEVLFQDDSSQIQVQLETQKLSAFSLALQTKPQVPIIDGILDGEIDAEADPEIQQPNLELSSLFKRFVLWRIIYLIRLFEKIGDREIFSSSISSLCLSICIFPFEYDDISLSLQWWFNRPDLNSALTKYIHSLLLSIVDNDDLLWIILKNTTETMTMDKNRRQRVKLILMKIAKLLPSNYMPLHLTHFFNLIVDIAKNKHLGENVVSYFTCFVPTSGSRLKFLDELKTRIDSEVKSEPIRSMLTNCFFNAKKKQRVKGQEYEEGP